MVGQPGGGAVGGGRRLRGRADGVPRHASLRQEPLELAEPRPQSPAWSPTCRRTHQVAARSPAGREAAGESLSVFIDQEGRCSCGRITKAGNETVDVFVRVSGQNWRRMIFRSSHGVPPFRGLCWLSYSSFCVFIFLLMAEFYCDQTLQFLSIYFAAVLWSQLLKPRTGHSGRASVDYRHGWKDEMLLQ